MRSVVSILLFCLIAHPSEAGEFVDERILAVQLSDGTFLADDLVTVRSEGQLWVPLTEFFQILGIKGDLDRKTLQFEGYISQSPNAFMFDFQNRDFRFKKDISSINPDSFRLDLAEVYIKTSELSRLLPLEFEVEFFKSLIVVDSKILLPIQVQKLRELKTRSQFRATDDSYKQYKRLPLFQFSGQAALLDQSFEYRYEKSNDPSSQSPLVQTSLRAEKNDIEMAIDAASSRRDLVYDRYQISKKDPEGRMSAGVTEISAIDINIPSRPLMHDLWLARGALISSFELNRGDRFDSTDFVGELKSGWQIELYRNGQFLYRSGSGELGRYEFKDVPIYYGINHFELRFYGPNGEERVENIFRYVDGTLSQRSTPQFYFAGGQVVDKSELYATHVSFPAGKNFSLGISGDLSRSDQNLENKIFGVESVASWKLFLLQMNYAQLDQNRADARGILARMVLPNFAINLNHELFDKDYAPFHLASKTFGLKQRFRSELDWTMTQTIPLRLTVGIQESLDYQGSYVRLLEAAWNLYIYDYFFRHVTQWSLSGARDWNSKLNLQKYFESESIETELSFDRNEFIAAFFEFRRSILHTYSLRARYEYLFQNQLSTWALGVRKEFRYLFAGLQVQRSSLQDSSFLAQVGYGLAVTTKGDIGLQGRFVTSGAAAHINVYLDRNGNGVKDEFDESLPGVKLLVNGRESEDESDAEGHIFVGGLPILRKVHIGIDLATLKDPLWQPVEQGITFMGKAGRVLIYDFAVVETGELDGFIKLPPRMNSSSAGGFRVQLTNQMGLVMKTVKTQSDGFFVFDGLRPGKYRIRLDDEQLEKVSLKSTPEFTDIELKGGYISGLNFQLD